MKLELNNFRCYYGRHVIEIADSGLSLIVGDSGIGKSTILNAIAFVLYGGTGTRNISYGESSCSVVLHYGNVVVKRSCKPTHLTVKHENSETLEDDAAQECINDMFGQHFDCISYIQQTVNKNFLSLSPTEKLELFESILFNRKSSEMCPSELKKKCTFELKTLTSEWDRLTGSIELLQSQSLDAPLEEDIHLNETMNTEEVTRRFFFLTNRQRLYDLFSQKIASTTAEADMLESELNSLPPNDNIHNFVDEKKLEKHIFALEQLSGFKWQNFTKYSLEDCIESIAEYEADIQTVRERQNLENTLKATAYDSTVHTALRHEYEELEARAEAVFHCPSCSSDLFLVNQELVLTAGAVVDAHNKKNLLRNYKTKIERMDSLAARDQDIRARLERHPYVNESIAELEEQLHKWINYKNRAELVARLKPFMMNSDLSLDAARNQLRAHQMSVQNKKRRDELDTRLVAIRRYVKQLLSFQMFTNPKPELESVRRQLSNAQLREKLLAEKTLAQKRRADEVEFRARRAKVEKRRQAMIDLKSLVARVETEYIRNKLRDIESDVNKYAAELFVNDPLVVQICTSNDNKNQLSIDIYYKNMRCGYSSLSGGEAARLNVCFTLALSQQFGGKLLLFDECTAQLDADASELVFNLLKNRTTCKTIIVAHGAVEGIFDEVIAMRV